MTRKILLFSMVLLLISSVWASDKHLKQLSDNSSNMSLPAIQERLEPVGEVRTPPEQTTSPAPTSTTPANQAAPTAEAKVVTRDGKTVYNQYCITCHEAGVAGAPKFHSAEDWKPREAKGINGLLQSAINGLNAMPPRGTCPDCTDAELKAAIIYMQPK